MFRNGLLISTAMTAVALLLSGADAAQAQTGMHVAYRDANARFLCNYGHFTVSFASGSSEGSGWLDNTRVAVPVVGRGQTVRHIVVMEALSLAGGRSHFWAGIYANKGGHPGKLIAGGAGHAQYVDSCQQVSISIPRTTLQPNTKYWIGEYVKGGRFDSGTFFWYVNPKEKRNAFVKTYRQSCSSGGQCSTYSQNWTRQTGPGPWFKLK